jgi:small subunit ribosomal protein S6
MKRMYEGMFLVNQPATLSGYTQIEREIKRVLTNHKASIISIEKWGDKKLAYPIRRRGEKFLFGTYILAYFEAPPHTIKDIRDDLLLSENVIRFLILQHKGEIKKVPFVGEERPEIEEEPL